MLPTVQQDQIQIRKFFFHLFFHESLQGNTAITIIGNKSNMLHFGVKLQNQLDILHYIVLVRKAQNMEFLHAIVNDIHALGFPIFQICPRFRQENRVTAHHSPDNWNIVGHE